MRVRFKKDWFGPSEHIPKEFKKDAPVGAGHLYQKTPEWEDAVELPDDYRALLHVSFATIVDEDDKPAPAPEIDKPVPLSSFAHEFDDGFTAVQEKAEANRVAGSRKPPRNA